MRANILRTRAYQGLLLVFVLLALGVLSAVVRAQSVAYVFPEGVEKIDAKDSVRAATTSALAANTRTGNDLEADANGALASQDGIALALRDRLLVKNEGTGANNGLYAVVALGDGSSKWKLRRAADADTSSKVTSGLAVFVSEGTTLGGHTFQLTTADTVTLNTTALTFSELLTGSGPPTGAAGGDLTGTYPNPTVATNAVALSVDTTGSYAAGDAEAGAALTGDTATAFFSAGTLEDARLSTSVSLLGQTIEGSEITNLTITAADVAADTLTAAEIAAGACTTSEILDGTIVDADVSGTAAVAFSKLATLTSANILVGSAGNVATSVAMSGDVAISNTGATTIQANSTALSVDTTGNYLADAVDGSGIDVTGTPAEGWTATVNLLYTDTLAGNPTMGAEECRMSTDGTGGGLICEGVTADTIEGLLVWSPTTSDRTLTLPDATDTIVARDTTDTLTNKTLAAASNVIDADTAIALAADPADCAANTFANAISTVGALTCSAVGDAALSSNYSGVGTCTNQFVRVLNDNAAPTCADVSLTVDTAGNYVASANTAALTGLTGGSAGSEGAALSLAFDYSATLAADPALAASNCVFASTGIICEGATANTAEALVTFADVTADRTYTNPDRSGTYALSGDTFTGDVTGTLDASGATTLTVAANAVALTVDSTGNYAADVTAGAGLTKTSAAGEGQTVDLSVLSTELGFLTDGGVSSLACGASTAGQAQVMDDGSFEWCDGAATPVLRQAAFADGTGNALTGDTATAFFSAGTIEDARLSANVSLLGQTIEGSEVTANTIDGTDIAIASQTSGDLMCYDGTDWVRIANSGGAASEVLTWASSACPTWEPASGGLGTFIDSSVAADNGQTADTYVAFGTDNSGASSSASATETFVDQYAIPATCTAKNLRVNLQNALTGGAQWTFTLRDDGASTALTCTISSGSATCSDTVNTASLVGNSKLAMLWDEIVDGNTVSGTAVFQCN